MSSSHQINGKTALTRAPVYAAAGVCALADYNHAWHGYPRPPPVRIAALPSCHYRDGWMKESTVLRTTAMHGTVSTPPAPRIAGHRTVEDHGRIGTTRALQEIHCCSRYVRICPLHFRLCKLYSTIVSSIYFPPRPWIWVHFESGCLAPIRNQPFFLGIPFFPFNTPHSLHEDQTLEDRLRLAWEFEMMG